MPIVTAQPLTADQRAALARLHNRQTRYELVLSKGDRHLLVGYTRKGTRGAIDLLTQRWDAVRQVINFADIHHGAGGALITTNGWWIGFSGRTQREAIIEGELPDIAA